MKTAFKFAVTFALLAPVCCWGQLGQYQTTLKHITIDLTNNVTQKGLNVWALMGGSQVCKTTPGSFSEGWDFTQWCIGTNSQVWEYNRKTHAWAQDPRGMSTAAVTLAVHDFNKIYALNTQYHCGLPDRQVILYTGSGAWQHPGINNCFSQLAVGGDGTLYAISKRSTAKNVLWISKDGGKTWSEWGSNFVFASLTDINRGCAVDTNGIVYFISPNQTPPQAALGSGIGAVGCAIGGEQSVIMAWTASGAVYYLDSQTNWASVKGLAANQIVALSKDSVLALDGNGVPHHWNYKPEGIQASMTGTGTHCGPSSCQGSALHAGTMGYYYASGHGISDGIPATKTVQWDLPIDGFTFQNANPMCDPHLGDPGSSECVFNTPSGGVECLQSGTQVGSLPPSLPPDDQISHDYNAFVSIADILGPNPSIVPGWWQGISIINTENACIGSLATCAGPNPYEIDVFSNSFAAAQVELQSAPLVDGPWLSETDYSYDLNGVPQCTPGTQITYPLFMTVAGGICD